jgi:hypothetical protein
MGIFDRFIAKDGETPPRATDQAFRKLAAGAGAAKLTVTNNQVGGTEFSGIDNHAFQSLLDIPQIPLQYPVTYLQDKETTLIVPSSEATKFKSQSGIMLSAVLRKISNESASDPIQPLSPETLKQIQHMSQTAMVLSFVDGVEKKLHSAEAGLSKYEESGIGLDEGQYKKRATTEARERWLIDDNGAIILIDDYTRKSSEGNYANICKRSVDNRHYCDGYGLSCPTNHGLEQAANTALSNYASELNAIRDTLPLVDGFCVSCICGHRVRGYGGYAVHKQVIFFPPSNAQPVAAKNVPELFRVPLSLESSVQEAAAGAIFKKRYEKLLSEKLGNLEQERRQAEIASRNANDLLEKARSSSFFIDPATYKPDSDAEPKPEIAPMQLGAV